MNLKKRASGLVATIGLLGGLLGAAAPSAHAAVIGGCTGIQLVDGFSSTGLPSSGAAVAAHLNLTTPTVNAAPSVVWSAGFFAAASSNNNGNGPTCTIQGNVHNDVRVSVSLAGVVSCDSASVDPTLFPLHGKLKLRGRPGNSFISDAYVQLGGVYPGQDPMGQDLITLAGIVTRGAGAGSLVSGQWFLDPIRKAAVNDDPDAIAGGAATGQVLRSQYYFDWHQIVQDCASGGDAISRVYIGDGTSLLFNTASGITFEI